MMPQLEETITWALGAAEILRQRFGQAHHVQHKGLTDLVTEADHQSEAYLVERIRSRYPDHRIITEEQGTLVGSQGCTWYIDPLDGTLNYAHSVPVYAVSVAFAVEGELQLGVIVDPSRGDVFAAARGAGATLNGAPIHVSATTGLIDSLLVTGFPSDSSMMERNIGHFARLTQASQGVRRMGSCAIDLCYVACGRFDGFWEVEIGDYDIAAGALIVQEAGGVASNIHGGRRFLEAPVSILAANPSIYPILLEELH